MEWLPREEVVLLLVALVASGCLLLGVLELIWPSARPRPVAPEPAPPPRRSPPKPPVLSQGPAATTAAPPTASAAAEPTALSVGRTLLERALEGSEPSPERRVAHLQAAVRWLERAVEAAPREPAVAEALAKARAALWATYQQIALQRLAAGMPWGATALARPTSLSLSLAERAADSGRDVEPARAAEAETPGPADEAPRAPEPEGVVAAHSAG